MNTVFKISRQLLRRIRSDLDRPHLFAAERVGFIAAGLAARQDGITVLAQAYRPLADDEYLPDSRVGAMMGAEAIRKALQWALKGRLAIFHVHAHMGGGIPGFSGIDIREHDRFVPNFFGVAANRAHGAIVLSEDAAFGRVWTSSSTAGQPINSFVETGSYLRRWGIA